MKKITRILSVALVAMMVLSLAAVAVAETPSVYIPKRLAKLVEAYVDDYVFPALVTKTDAAYNKKIKHMTANTDDGVIHFQFSEKPDWFGAVVSSKNGGWINIDVDDSGYGELEMEGLARQPGTWSYNGYWNAKKNKWIDNASNPDKDGETYHITGGDYPYTAGKDYGEYSVVVNYHRNGAPYQVAVSLKDTDLFRTGVEGAISTITFSLVNVELDSYSKISLNGHWDPDLEKFVVDKPYVKPNNKYVETVYDDNGDFAYVLYDTVEYPYFELSSTDMWYVSAVSATYPEGNYIVGVEADYYNDAKNNLCQYKVSYAVSEKDVAEIYYKPWDSAFYGQYSRNDSVIAVSGSGNNLNKWYKYNGSETDVDMVVRDYNDDGEIIGTHIEKVKKVNNNGKQVKTIKKGIFSYPSPRVK